jgi:hypothetical protein
LKLSFLSNVVVLISAIAGCFISTVNGQSISQDDLKTKTSNSIGLTLSSYAYTEPNLTDVTGTTMSVNMNATNIGIEHFGTYSFQNNWFLMDQLDYNTGNVSYSGSGTQSGIPQYYFNLKGAVGYDFAFEGFNLSPYIGIGYRYLSQQWGNTTTSNGAPGYNRQSTYNYIPIGVIHRVAMNGNKATLETMLEYDYFISGNQFSGLSVLNGGTFAGIPDVNNKQSSGYGLNLSVMYKQEKWGFGPYVKYWNIGQSDSVSAIFTKNGARFLGTVFEPANNTVEYGVKVVYLF